MFFSVFCHVLWRICTISGITEWRGFAFSRGRCSNVTKVWFENTAQLCRKTRKKPTKTLQICDKKVVQLILQIDFTKPSPNVKGDGVFGTRCDTCLLAVRQNRFHKTSFHSGKQADSTPLTFSRKLKLDQSKLNQNLAVCSQIKKLISRSSPSSVVQPSVAKFTD